MTVEQYLNSQCELMINVGYSIEFTIIADRLFKDVRRHGENLVAKYRQEYKQQLAEISLLLQHTTAPSKISIVSISLNFYFAFIAANVRICVLLKCIKGPHAGQKFRLESSAVSFTCEVNHS
jgi:hypothetical protein